MTKLRDNTSNGTPQAAIAEARKKWEQAAFRNGMFFILFPAIFPFPLISTLHWLPQSLTLTVAIVIGWMVMVFSSVAYGWFRIRKYKRDHPFVAHP